MVEFFLLYIHFSQVNAAKFHFFRAWERDFFTIARFFDL